MNGMNTIGLALLPWSHMGDLLRTSKATSMPLAPSYLAACTLPYPRCQTWLLNRQVVQRQDHLRFCWSRRPHNRSPNPELTHADKRHTHMAQCRLWNLFCLSGHLILALSYFYIFIIYVLGRWHRESWVFDSILSPILAAGGISEIHFSYLEG